MATSKAHQPLEPTAEAKAALLNCIDKHLLLGTGNPARQRWQSGGFGKASTLGNLFSSIRSGSKMATAGHLDKIERAFFPTQAARASANEHYWEWSQVRAAYLGIKRAVEPIESPTLSRLDVWNILLKPIRANATSIIHEGGGHGVVPWFSAADISFSVLPKRFILPVPQWFADWASGPGSGEYETRAPVDLSGAADLSDFYSTTPVPNLPAIVAKHAEAYAKEVYVQYEAAGTFPPYNKEKLGLYSYRQPLLANRPERAYMNFRVYTTDYFTHRVMRRILRELQASHPNWFTATDDFYAEHPFLRYFTTSFGLNLVVTTTNGSARNYHLVRVSSRLGNENQRSTLHITANEGLNTDDIIESKVDVVKYSERALAEELGVISTDAIESTVYIEFAMEMRNFEPYISGITHLRMTEADLNLARARYARDDRRETTTRSLITFPFTAAGLVQPLLENDRGLADFSSYSLLILDSIIARKELFQGL